MKFILNKTQTFYYKRAILGLRIYTPEQIGLMTKEKKDRIRKVSKKANLIIQTLRYQKLVEYWKSPKMILSLHYLSPEF